MKKHIFAFICIFMLLFNTFAYTPSKAMDIGVAIDVGSDVLYYGWDMLNSLINGFTISLAEYSGYADKAAAMGAYYDDWQNVLLGLTNWFVNTEDDEIPAISMKTAYPLDYGMTNAVMRDFINQYGGFVYDPTQSVYAPINTKSIAAWNRFQDGWVKRYLNEFNKNIEQHPTYADPFYESFINVINGTGFDFLRNIQNVDASFINSSLQSGRYFIYRDLPWTNRSWYSANKNNNGTNWSLSNINTYYPIYGSSGIDDVFITSSGGTYSVTLTNHYYNLPLAFDGGVNNGVPVYGNLLYSVNMGGSIGYILKGDANFTVGSSNDWQSLTYSGSLGEVFTWLESKVRNVNIYVDNVLWSYVGRITDPLVTAPDVIFNETGDIIGNDVWFPEQDLKADLVKFTELIDDKILTGDTLTIDDVIDAGVLTDENGNIITQENRDEYLIKKSVSTVIADALVDDPAAGFLPDAPLPPDEDPWNWQFPTIVIPEGGDANPRRTGLSVLARIVNVTNQGLPAELITMFWGICITLLIIGIIKILHK